MSRGRPRAAVRLALVASIVLVVTAGLDGAAQTVSAAPRWRPAVRDTWQVQFSGRIDLAVHADVFDLDLFDTPPSSVAALHARGRRVVCYVNAGAWEQWRPDAGRYPRSLLGRELEGWPGERWLDIRRIDLLAPVLHARMDACRRKGFDGVEFDNVDGYANRTGFPLTPAHQLRFDRWLAAEARSRGLAVGLKNDLEQVRELEPSFDFAINESCWTWRECELLRPFRQAGKAVLVIEYAATRAEFCPTVKALGYVGMRKRLALDAWRAPCA
jgi:hypothetical protein